MKLVRFLFWAVRDAWRRFAVQDEIQQRWHGKVLLADDVRVQSPDRLIAGESAYVDHGCYLHCGDAEWCRGQGRIEIGARSYIGPQSILFGMGGIEIGTDVMVSPNCVISSVQHPYADMSKPMFHQERVYEKVVIEDDVYLGSNVVITPGVRVGRGAVVGAGAVVTRDIEPFGIAVGVPARVVETRKSGAFGKQQESAAVTYLEFAIARNGIDVVISLTRGQTESSALISRMTICGVALERDTCGYGERTWGYCWIDVSTVNRTCSSRDRKYLR